MIALSERIDALAGKADELHTEIRDLCYELNSAEWDYIDSVEHLADVPGDMDTALHFASSLYDALDMAWKDAKKGGQ